MILALASTKLSDSVANQTCCLQEAQIENRLLIIKQALGSLITKDVDLICVPVQVEDRLLLSFVRSEHTLVPKYQKQISFSPTSLKCYDLDCDFQSHSNSRVSNVHQFVCPFVMLSRVIKSHQGYQEIKCIIKHHPSIIRSKI